MALQEAGSLLSPSAASTREAGRLLGELLAGGDVVALSGPLGAGKTVFVKGLAAGLGIEPAAVSSPTFVIAQQYFVPPAASPRPEASSRRPSGCRVVRFTR